MATVESDLVTMLTAESDVTTFTSTTRIYPVRFPPQTTIPADKGAILYTLLAGSSTNTTFEGDSGLHTFVFQLDCITHEHAHMTQLREAVRKALVGKSYGRIRKVLMANLAISVWERDIDKWRGVIDVRLLCEAGT